MTDNEVWYIALRNLHIKQAEGVVPSSIRIRTGQRFQLDGDEGVSADDLLQLGAMKLYDESDREWADTELANAPKPRRRRRRVSGTNNSEE